MERNVGAMSMHGNANQGAISIVPSNRALLFKSGPVAQPAGTQDLACAAPLRADAPTEISLSDGVLAELHWIASEGSPSLSRHARIILARHEGRSLSEIAKILDVDRATVRRWLWRFQKGGLRGLVHASTGQTRKRRFNDTVRDAVARIAMAPPSAVGESFDHWSLRRLRVHVLQHAIVQEISVEGLRQLLRGLPLPETHWRQGAEPLSPLAEDVRQGLEMLADSPDAEVARRTRMVLARSRGLSEPEVATALGVGRSCVRRWVQRFERHGMLGLQTARRPSHPLVFTPDVRAAIVRYARMDPKQLGAAGPRWSLRTLRAALIRQRVVRKISIQHLGRILAEAGVSLRGQPVAPVAPSRVPAQG